MVVDSPWSAEANHAASQSTERQPTAFLPSMLPDSLGILGNGSKCARCRNDLQHSECPVFVLLLLMDN